MGKKTRKASLEPLVTTSGLDSFLLKWKHELTEKCFFLTLCPRVDVTQYIHGKDQILHISQPIGTILANFHS